METPALSFISNPSNIFNLLNLWLQDALGLGRREATQEGPLRPGAHPAGVVSARQDLTGSEAFLGSLQGWYCAPRAWAPWRGEWGAASLLDLGAQTAALFWAPLA